MLMLHLNWKRVIFQYKAGVEKTIFTSHWLFDWFCLMEWAITHILHEYIQQNKTSILQNSDYF